MSDNVGISQVVLDYLNLYKINDRKMIKFYAIHKHDCRFGDPELSPMITEIDVAKLNTLKERLTQKKFTLKKHPVVVSIGVVLVFDDNHKVSICCGDTVVANAWSGNFCEVQFQGEFTDDFSEKNDINDYKIKKYRTSDDLISDLEAIRDKYFS